MFIFKSIIPSIVLIVFLQPNAKSVIDTGKSIYTSLPSLLYNSCGIILTSIYKSPLGPPLIPASPFPLNLKFLSLLHNLVIKSYNDLEKKCG